MSTPEPLQHVAVEKRYAQKGNELRVNKLSFYHDMNVLDPGAFAGERRYYDNPVAGSSRVLDVQFGSDSMTVIVIDRHLLRKKSKPEEKHAVPVVRVTAYPIVREEYIGLHPDAVVAFQSNDPNAKPGPSRLLLIRDSSEIKATCSKYFWEAAYFVPMSSNQALSAVDFHNRLHSGTGE